MSDARLQMDLHGQDFQSSAVVLLEVEAACLASC